jgi:hypothetical protein
MGYQWRSSVILGFGLVVAALAVAQEPPAIPTSEEVVRRACDAAGGLKAFTDLGIVGLATRSEEVSQEGSITTTLQNNYFLAPGPIPGRYENPDKKVVAGDDGSGGWAVINEKPDTRLSTARIVKRQLTTSLFPTLLPFSLTWDGVEVQEVKAAQLKGHPVWQRTILIDSTSFAVVRAESPFTDLGKGVTADGMRFTWREPVEVKDVTFYKEQKLTGLDEAGVEKTHSRVDRLQYHVIPISEAKKLFANPIPLELRPKPPAMQPPHPPATQPNG